MPYLQKYVFQKKSKDINSKVFNMVTNKNEAKTVTACDCKCKFDSATCNSNKKWHNRTYQGEFQNYHKCKKD